MKKLLYLAAVAACFFLVSCKSTPKPSGDAEKDAKACVDFYKKAFADATEAIKAGDFSKFKKISNQIEEVEKKFDEYCKDEKNKEYKEKFDKACEGSKEEINKLTNEMITALASAPEDFKKKMQEEAEKEAKK